MENFDASFWDDDKSLLKKWWFIKNGDPELPNPGWLFDKGDDILPNYMGIIS